MKIHIFALAALGDGISGGDRIFIELARRWSKKHEVNIYLWEEGVAMINRQELSGKYLKVHLIKVGRIRHLGFLITYFYRVLLGILLGFQVRLGLHQNILYSASEFWMDALPGLILKLRYRSAFWSAAWYQSAPSPLKGFNEAGTAPRSPMRAFMYWFMQITIKPFVKLFADVVVVNNEYERKRFPEHSTKDRVIVMYGAVDLARIRKYQSKHKAVRKPKYDAVFQGRFHPQKGVVELTKIWSMVVAKKPNARLAMIGDGPLMREVKMKIKSLKLEKNIALLGYLYDGDKKYDVFNSSKIVVHPAYYDSGGMASAEAMAFGKPCVAFNLISYESYYPKGMLKVSQNDKSAFAKAILELLSDNNLYKRLAKESLEMIRDNWSWDSRASDILNKLVKYHGRLPANL